MKILRWLLCLCRNGRVHWDAKEQGWSYTMCPECGRRWSHFGSSAHRIETDWSVL